MLKSFIHGEPSHHDDSGGPAHFYLKHNSVSSESSDEDYSSSRWSDPGESPPPPTTHITENPTLCDLNQDMETPSSDAAWYDRLDELTEFKAKEGHCIVPNFYPDYPKLGHWVANQRLHYNHHHEGKKHMSDHQIRRLEEVGFSWHPPNDRLWLVRFEEIKRFKSETGHCMVPNKYLANTSLGNWVCRQRLEYKHYHEGMKSAMTCLRMKRLDGIGFSWNSWPIHLGKDKLDTGAVAALKLSRDAKEIRLEDMKWEKDQEIHCAVTVIDEETLVLAKSIKDRSCQDKLIHDDKLSRLSEDRVSELDSLKHDEISVSSSTSKEKSHKSNHDTWMEHFEELKKFQHREGHGMVPEQYSEHPKLCKWVRQQRYLYKRYHEGKKCSLTEVRMILLKEIGFVAVERNTNAWMGHYDELIQFKARESHCMVPNNYYENPTLGNWVCRQRYEYKRFQLGRKSTMTAYRIALLDKIGICWNAKELTKRKASPLTEKRVKTPEGNGWMLLFDELVQFKSIEGHCMVPHRYQDNPQLGYWVCKQRHMYKGYYQGKKSTVSGDVAEYRVKALDKIGFSWNPKKPGWMVFFEQMKRFKSQEGHCMVPLQYSKNPNLGKWVEDQRRKPEYVSEDIITYRVQMLDEIGFSWETESLLKRKAAGGLGEDPEDDCSASSVPSKRVKQDNNYQVVHAEKSNLCTTEEGNHMIVGDVCESHNLIRTVSQEICNHKPKNNGKKPSLLQCKEKIPEESEADFNFMIVAKDHNLWFNNLIKLKKFQAREGHCIVPVQYAESPKLGKWVSEQRLQYKLHHEGEISALSGNQLKALGKIGIFFNSWMLHFEELRQFKDLEGHCIVPGKYSEFPLLSRWITNQRLDYKHHQEGKKIMSEFRIKALEEVGFSWNLSCDYLWSVQLEKLKRFIYEEGHCMVPTPYSEQPTLGNWVRRQRVEYNLLCDGRKSRMTEYRMKALDKIHFSWSAKNPVKCKLPSITELGVNILDEIIDPKDAIYETPWFENFEELKKFKSKEGHCKVPSLFPENPKLGHWVRTQRAMCKNHLEGKKTGVQRRVIRYRIKFLDEIGFSWCVPSHNDDQWIMHFEELTQFKEKEGHCVVPYRYFENLKLSNWVCRQRTEYKRYHEGIKSTMTEYRIKALDGIGFSWINKEMVKECLSTSTEDKSELPEETDFGFSVISEVGEQVSNGQSMQVEKLQETRCNISQNHKLDSISIPVISSKPKHRPDDGEMPQSDNSCDSRVSYSKHDSNTFNYNAKTNASGSILHSNGVKSSNNVTCYDAEETSYEIPWFDKFEELKIFKSKEGHCNVPYIFQENPALGQWVVLQRVMYKNYLEGKKTKVPAHVTKYQIHFLDQIGFSWGGKILMKCKQSALTEEIARVPEVTCSVRSKDTKQVNTAQVAHAEVAISLLGLSKMG